MSAMTAAQVRAQTGRMDQVPVPEVPERPRPPRVYPAGYKLRVLAAYEQLDKAGKGALLRREGLYTSLLSEWRKQRDRGALPALEQRRGRPPVDPRVRELGRLERENARLREQLAKANRAIEVQGELSATPRSEPGTQLNDPVSVTVTARWLPSLPASCGMWVAWPVRTTMARTLAPAGD